MSWQDYANAMPRLLVICTGSPLAVGSILECSGEISITVVEAMLLMQLALLPSWPLANFRLLAMLAMFVTPAAIPLMVLSTSRWEMCNLNMRR